MKFRLYPARTLALGLLLLLPGAASLAQSPQSLANTDAQIAEAVKAVNNGDYATAQVIYNDVAWGTAPDILWDGVGGLLALYRETGDASAAYQLTAEVTFRKPEFAGLMAVWNGDTAAFFGDTASALAHYQAALNPATDALLEGANTKVGAVALRQIARLHLANQDPAAAAEAHRELLRRYPAFVWPEFETAQAAALDAMAAGQLPVKPLAALLHDGDCTEGNPCNVSGQGTQGGSGSEEEGQTLASLGGLRFALSPADAGLLSDANAARAAALAVPPTGPSIAPCDYREATHGFARPMENTGTGGYNFMTPIGSGAYHPALDINEAVPPGGNCDIEITNGTKFFVPARGCVHDAAPIPSSWGSGIIEHRYGGRTLFTQYGHARTMYYSTGVSVPKGAGLGKVGDVGTDCAHLHFEVRESDHPDPRNADYYSNLTQSNVGKWYQDPFPALAAHRDYASSQQVDEHQFTYPPNSGWTYTNTIGNLGDMRWGLTVPTSSQRYARYYFYPGVSGNYEFWAFVPWDNGTSQSARYKVARSNGTVVSSTVYVNQAPLLDAYVRVGGANLTAGTEYYLEVSAATGESGRKVALDDVLIHRLP